MATENGKSFKAVAWLVAKSEATDLLLGISTRMAAKARRARSKCKHQLNMRMACE